MRKIIISDLKNLTVIYSEQYLKYDFGPEHPIWAKRATVFLEKLKISLLSYNIVAPTKVLDENLLLVHTPKYLNRLRVLTLAHGSLSADTPVDPNILEAAYFSTGGTILATEQALTGQKTINLLGGMHHAGAEHSSGFCIFNDHAVAIKKLQKEGKIKTAMVFDLDAHAGDGTQEIFYTDPSVFTISLHQDPETLYPGTGFAWQEGAGPGLGYNKNVILSPGTTENEYIRALDCVLPLAKVFNPDLIVLVLGVDTYKEDPLASLKLEKETYTIIGERFGIFKNLTVMFAGGYSHDTPDLWMNFLKGYLTI